MVARRLLIVLAVLLGLTALAAGVAPRDPLDHDPGPPPATAAPPQLAKGTVTKTLDAGATGQVVDVRVGQTLELTVKSDTLETVSIDQYGDQTAEADSPAHFEILADVPGSYAIDLLEPTRQIGTLEMKAAD